MTLKEKKEAKDLKNNAKEQKEKGKNESGAAKRRRKRKKIVLPDPEPGAFDSMLTKVPEKKAEKKKISPDANSEEDSPHLNKTNVKKIKPPKRKKIKVTEEDQPDPEELALTYLKTWKKNRANWSFKKVRQVWLLQHIYDDEKISSKNFKVLLDYLSGAKGAAKTKTIEEAEKLFADASGTEELTVKIQRARDIIQHLR